MKNLKENMTLKEVQDYFYEVSEKRGFNGQTTEQKMLLLIEEVGELAKAIRKEHTDLMLDRETLINTKEELADVIIVLISLCNKLELDLFEIIKDKEKINNTRVWND